MPTVFAASGFSISKCRLAWAQKANRHMGICRSGNHRSIEPVEPSSVEIGEPGGTFIPFCDLSGPFFPRIDKGN